MTEWILQSFSVLEVWVIAHYKIISFAFGLLAAFGVGAGIIYKAAIVMRNTRLDKEAYKDALSGQIMELSRKIDSIDQRQEFQSEFMSYQEQRYNDSESHARRVGDALIDNAIDSAIVKQLLQNNNITTR